MKLGKKGEEIAARYLESKKYKILKRNFSCMLGEIDIIAALNNTLIFVEVKTRANLKYGLPRESVNKQKLKKIINVINYYLYINKQENISIQIDVIEVFIKDNREYLNHIENVGI